MQNFQLYLVEWYFRRFGNQLWFDTELFVLLLICLLLPLILNSPLFRTVSLSQIDDQSFTSLLNTSVVSGSRVSLQCRPNSTGKSRKTADIHPYSNIIEEMEYKI